MEPIEKLKQLTAWDAEPALTVNELEDLLVRAALEDASGLAPRNEEWTPTYDINAAAAAGWLIKAARAASTTEVEAGLVTAKIFDNCRTMARIFASKRKAATNLR